MPYLLNVTIVNFGVFAHDHYVEFCVVVMFPLTKNPVLLGVDVCLLLRTSSSVPPITLLSIVALIAYVLLRTSSFVLPIDLPAKVSFGSSYVVFFVVEFLLSFVEIYHFQTTPWMKSNLKNSVE